MFWLSWRQSRLELLIGGAALVLVASFLLWTGLGMVSAYRDADLRVCETAQADEERCFNAAGAFIEEYGHLDDLTGWLNLLPLLFGLLLAAPTVLDLEQGTYRLAWTQSVTRRRWMAAKIGFGFVFAVGAGAVMIALMTWWRRPFDTIEGRLIGDAFDFEGPAPIAYLVFAFALCLSLGTLIRRAVPSVGLSFALFLAARLGVIEKVRPHYLSPARVSWDPTEPAPPIDMRPFFGDGNWIIGQHYVDAEGHRVSAATLDAIAAACDRAAGGNAEGLYDQCLHDRGFLNTLLYHPANRFWTFQVIETALFLGVSAVLLGITFWWVTRRVV